MKFSVYQESRQGPRKSNQDRVAYCYSRDALCMVIADGMGGHLHGELRASVGRHLLGGCWWSCERAGRAMPQPRPLVG